MKRAIAVLRSPWTWLAAAVLAGLLVAWKLNGLVGAADAGRRAAEREALRAQGLAVAWERTARELATGADDLGRRYAGLEGELARIRKASPGAHPVLTIEGSTAPVVVEVPPAAPGAARECLLWAGDKGAVRLAGVGLETRAGNLVLGAVAEAWRVEPAPERRLFGGPLHLDVGRLAPEPARPWAGGLFAGCSAAGCGVGPAVGYATTHLDLSVGAAFVGRFSAGATLLWRP